MVIAGCYDFLDARKVTPKAPCHSGTGSFGAGILPTLCVAVASDWLAKRRLWVGWTGALEPVFTCRKLSYSASSVQLMVERIRRAGTCPKCNAPRTERVDDMYVEGQVAGRDAPYDTQVLRAWCTPGCSGPDDLD